MKQSWEDKIENIFVQLATAKQIDVQIFGSAFL